MEISRQKCVVGLRDHIHVVDQEDNRVMFYATTTAIVLSKDDAIELAMDILVHYNVYMSA